MTTHYLVVSLKYKVRISKIRQSDIWHQFIMFDVDLVPDPLPDHLPLLVLPPVLLMPLPLRQQHRLSPKTLLMNGQY